MGSRQNKPSGRSRWELSRDALDHLLQRLDPDRDAAGRAYEALRRRLIDLFAWEHGEAPEELADEALNRLARRLSEGVAIDGGIARYAFGIARLLLHEQSRARRNREKLRSARSRSSREGPKARRPCSSCSSASTNCPRTAAI